MRNRRASQRAHRHATHASRPPARRPDRRPKPRPPGDRPIGGPPLRCGSPDDRPHDQAPGERPYDQAPGERPDDYVRRTVRSDAEWRALYVGPYIALEANGRVARSLEAVCVARSRAILNWRGCYGVCYPRYAYAIVRRQCACGEPLSARFVGSEVLALSGCYRHAHDGRDGGECPTPGTRDDCDRCYWRCWECGAHLHTIMCSGIVCRDCADLRRAERSRIATPAVTFAARFAESFRLPWFRVENDAGADYGWPLARVLWLAMAAGAVPAAAAIARRYPRLFDALALWAVSRYMHAAVSRDWFRGLSDCRSPG